MSKYLALLALPPPLKKLRAIWDLPAAATGQPIDDSKRGSAVQEHNREEE